MGRVRARGVAIVDGTGNAGGQPIFEHRKAIIEIEGTRRSGDMNIKVARCAGKSQDLLDITIGITRAAPEECAISGFRGI